MNPQAPLAASQLPRNSHKSLIIAIILAVLLVASVIFGFLAYSHGQDYKQNSDTKSAAAVEAAKTAQATELKAQFEEQSKSPYKTYQSQSVAGSITFSYPKTWSAYVDETDSSQLINGYFHPSQVPGTKSTVAFALRLEMLSQDYSQVIAQYNSQDKKATLSAAAYVPPKMVGVSNVQTGIRFDGAIAKDKNGSLVVIRVRDKTLKIYTESKDYLSDFNNIVLSSLKFSP